MDVFGSHGTGRGVNESWVLADRALTDTTIALGYYSRDEYLRDVHNNSGEVRKRILALKEPV